MGSEVIDGKGLLYLLEQAGVALEEANEIIGALKRENEALQAALSAARDPEG